MKKDLPLDCLSVCFTTRQEVHAYLRLLAFFKLLWQLVHILVNVTRNSTIKSTSLSRLHSINSNGMNVSGHLNFSRIDSDTSI